MEKSGSMGIYSASKVQKIIKEAPIGMLIYLPGSVTAELIIFLTGFIAVAHYNSIYVLTDKERFIAEEEFGNELQDVRNELIGLGVDVVNNFDNHPDGLPKINFKYKVKDEKYLYDSLSPIFFNPQNRMWRYRNFYDGRIEKCLKF